MNANIQNDLYTMCKTGSCVKTASGFYEMIKHIGTYCCWCFFYKYVCN